MGGPISTPVPTSMPTAVPSPLLPTDLTPATFVPVWMIWLIVIAAIGIMIGLAFVPAAIAKKKGYSYGGFWVFGFFLFIPAIIVAAAINTRNSTPSSPQGQPPYNQPYQQPPAQQNTCFCPHCGKMMPAESTFCPSCGSRVG